MVTLSKIEEKAFLAIKYIQELNNDKILADSQNIFNFIKGNKNIKNYSIFKECDEVFESLPKVTKNEIIDATKSLVNKLYICEIDDIYYIVNNECFFYNSLSAKDKTLALEIIKLIMNLKPNIKHNQSFGYMSFKTNINNIRWFSMGYNVSGEICVWLRERQSLNYKLETFILCEEQMDDIKNFIKRAISLDNLFAKKTNDVYGELTLDDLKNLK